MITYRLYLESGPRQKTTMVHVLDLLGCIAQGNPTAAAVENTSSVIQRFLAFLNRHGEQHDLLTPFETQVVQHVIEGPWLGYGDPAPGFEPDFEPLHPDMLATHIRRLNWIQQDILDLIRELNPIQLNAQPDAGWRPIGQILVHLAESQSVYLRYQVGKVDGLTEPLKILQQDPAYAVPALTDFWSAVENRLSSLSSDELQAMVPHGQVTWTAHRCLRRMLEHSWEHFSEISKRLGYLSA